MVKILMIIICVLVLAGCSDCTPESWPTVDLVGEYSDGEAIVILNADLTGSLELLGGGTVENFKWEYRPQEKHITRAFVWLDAGVAISADYRADYIDFGAYRLEKQ